MLANVARPLNCFTLSSTFKSYVSDTFFNSGFVSFHVTYALLAVVSNIEMVGCKIGVCPLERIPLVEYNHVRFLVHVAIFQHRLI